MKHWTAASVAVCIAGLTACGRKPEAERAEPAPPVKIAEAEAAAPERVREFAGRIKAARRVELSFPLAGILSEFPVAKGQAVGESDVLARLDTRDLLTTEAMRKARFEEADLQYRRMQRLRERDAIATADLERSKAAFEVAKADLEQVRKDLEDSTLKAPFKGRVAQTMADRFQNIQAKQPILVLHDISRFDIGIDLPDTFITEVGQNSNLLFTARFDHLPGREFPLETTGFATEADPDTQTYAVDLSLQATGDILLPGMPVTVRVRLPPPATAGCWVPVSAILAPDGRTPQAWLVDPSTMTVKARTVKVGALRGDRLQVLEGLQAGDRVAASGVHTLREGQTVKPFDGFKAP